MRTAVVVPVHRNACTLPELASRLDAVLPTPWRLHLIVDACPEGSAEVAERMAAGDDRIRTTVLTRNVGQHRAIAIGLAAEPHADAWVCLDADLQDPPEVVPVLTARLRAADCSGVFAGRRGRYESRVRRVTGDVHRRALSRLTGLPQDAGAFFAMDEAVRDAVVDGVLLRGAPSVVVAAADSGLPLVSVPVRRDVRERGTSSWTGTGRARQSARTLTWALRQQLRQRLRQRHRQRLGR